MSDGDDDGLSPVTLANGANQLLDSVVSTAEKHVVLAFEIGSRSRFQLMPKRSLSQAPAPPHGPSVSGYLQSHTGWSSPA